MSDPHVTTIIGLEVHVQLRTESKLFCGCSTKFGAPPNTQTCPVCLGLPGSLPVINRRALELGMLAGLALEATIPNETKWDRKNYFYPDLPKGYQISQFDQPIAAEGSLVIRDPKGRFDTKRIGIIRAHLEEDAGKSLHDSTDGNLDDRTRIDLNRTGTPLLEIVSHPHMNSPAEARAYLNELKLLLTYLDVSDCNMQEGSLRVDANVNLHIGEGEEQVATPIVEIKNMNSFRAVERALEYEAGRQLEEWIKTKKQIGHVPKQTRGWDDQSGRTFVQREKEESSDYRYFPDPDLVPIHLSDEEIQSVKMKIGETPSGMRDRLATEFELSEYDADVLVNQGRSLVQYFESVANLSKDFKRASNWIQQEVMRHLNEHSIGIDQFPIGAEELGQIVKSVSKGSLDNSRAKEVFALMIETSLSFETAKESLGISDVSGDDLDSLCDEIINDNEAAVADLLAGKQQAIGALIGQARKRNPNINPGQFRSRLLERIQNRT